MTFGELKRSVLALGFERELDDSADLIPALKRSLHSLFLDRPVLKTVRLPKPSKRIRLIAKEIHHRPGSIESYTAIGRALSFTVSGKGKYIFSVKDIVREHSFDSSLGEVRSFIGEGCTVSFVGEYGYTVYDLAVCEELTSERIEDVPLWGERLTTDLKKSLGDYLGPYKQPESSSGLPIAGAYISDGVMHIPENHYGPIVLTYRRAPSMPGGYEDSEAIDVPNECAELLPLLVASYIWLDDDPDKADLYRALYRDGMGTLVRFMPKDTGSPYLTNGWA